MNKQDLRRFEEMTFKRRKIVVYHNLPNTWGLNIENAFPNWEMRTDKETAEDFVKYVKSKNTGHDIMTEEDYKKL